LVTTDRDFWGRWVRSNLLASHGVEVIVFPEIIADSKSSTVVSRNIFLHRKRRSAHTDMTIGSGYRPRAFILKSSRASGS